MGTFVLIFWNRMAAPFFAVVWSSLWSFKGMGSMGVTLVRQQQSFERAAGKIRSSL